MSASLVSLILAAAAWIVVHIGVAGTALRGVIVRAMSRLCVAVPRRSALLMGFSGYPLRTIAPAVARLAKAFP